MSLRLEVTIEGIDPPDSNGQFEVVSISLHHDLTIITYAVPIDLTDDTGDCEYRTITSDSTFFGGIK